MRKLIVAAIISLDGYFDGAGADVWAMPMDGFFDAHNLQRMRAADTLLFGRTTFEAFLDFWPPVAADPSVSRAVQLDPRVADRHREIGERCGTTPKVVISDSLTPAQTGVWADTTSIVPRADTLRAVAELKRRPGRDILMFGSRTVWTNLLNAGLVDELHLMIGAVVLGAGTPAFDHPVSGLRLFDVERHPGSDNVVLRYRL